MTDAVIKVMCEAWTEMNTVRARDGVPYTHNGYKSDVSQEYWDDIMRRLDDEVKAATGRGCWLHPALFNHLSRKSESAPQQEQDSPFILPSEQKPEPEQHQ